MEGTEGVIPVGLILAAGMALGAFQAGLYAALDEAATLRVDAVAGSSIGAINGAIIAGNPPEKRTEMLTRFWKRVETDPAPSFHSVFDVPHSPLWRSLSAIGSTMMSRFGGVPGLIRPGALTASKAGEGPGLYDPSPSIATLEQLIDFDLLNEGPVRLCICATDVETGEVVLFDTRAGDRIGPEHILASGALMPNLPAMRVGGRLLADGGLCVNAPMEPFLSSERSGDIPRWLILADLFSVQGAIPRSLAAAAERAIDLKFGCQTRVRLSGLERERRLEASAASGSGSDGTDLVVVELREPKEPARMEKAFDFSRASLSRRYAAGRKAAALALEVIRAAQTDSPAGLRIHKPQDEPRNHGEHKMADQDRDEGAENRGKRAQEGVGEVKGSGAGAGGGGNPEDFDIDAPGGSGTGSSGISSPQAVEGDDAVIPPTKDSPKG